MTLPLEGLKVLDLSRLLPGAYLTDLLAGLGADVIKVEAVEGDGLRHIGPHVDGEAYPMWALARGKRSVVLDLKQPVAVQAFLRMAATADVVLEGFRPGVTDRLGIGYAACREVNPAIVYASLSGYPADGPHAKDAGHDINFLAATGVLGVGAGVREDAVRPLPVPFADLTSSVTAGLGVLAAVLGARATGQGRQVAVAMADATLNLIGVELQEQAASGTTTGTLSGVLPCYATYRCADGRWLAVGALEPKFWANFCTAVDRPDLVARQSEPDAVADVAAMIGEHPLAHWTGLLDGADACTTGVATPAEVAAGLPSLPGGGLDLATPFAIDGARVPRTGRPPALGADTRAVLVETGCDEATLDALTVRVG